MNLSRSLGASLRSVLCASLLIGGLVACSTNDKSSGSGAPSATAASPANDPAAEAAAALARQQAEAEALRQAIIDMEDAMMEAWNAYEEQSRLRKVYDALGMSEKFKWGKRTSKDYHLDILAESSALLNEIRHFHLSMEAGKYWHDGCKTLNDEFAKDLVKSVAKLSGRVDLVTGEVVPFNQIESHPRLVEGRSALLKSVRAKDIYALIEKMFRAISKEENYEKKETAFGCVVSTVSYISDLTMRIPRVDPALIDQDPNKMEPAAPSLANQEIRILQVARAVHKIKQRSITALLTHLDILRQLAENEERTKREKAMWRTRVQTHVSAESAKKFAIGELIKDLDALKGYESRNFEGQESQIEIPDVRETLELVALDEGPYDTSDDEENSPLEVIQESKAAIARIDDHNEELDQIIAAISGQVADTKAALISRMTTKIHGLNISLEFSHLRKEIQDLAYFHDLVNKAYVSACKSRQQPYTNFIATRDANYERADSLLDATRMPQVVVEHLVGQEDGAEDEEPLIGTSLEVLEIWYNSLAPQVEAIKALKEEIDAEGNRVYGQRNVRSVCPPPSE